MGTAPQVLMTRRVPPRAPPAEWHPVPLAVKLGLTSIWSAGGSGRTLTGPRPLAAALGPPLGLGILASASEVRDCIWKKLEV